jgi:hypothetical protein
VVQHRARIAVRPIRTAPLAKIAVAAYLDEIAAELSWCDGLLPVAGLC